MSVNITFGNVVPTIAESIYNIPKKAEEYSKTLDNAKNDQWIMTKIACGTNAIASLLMDKGVNSWNAGSKVKATACFAGVIACRVAWIVGISHYIGECPGFLGPTLGLFDALCMKILGLYGEECAYFGVAEALSLRFVQWLR